jgi:hypothetical protein
METDKFKQVIEKRRRENEKE